MKLKKTLTFALAALYFVMAAFPAQAIGASFSGTSSYYGAQVYRQGSLVSATVNASISISFVSGVDHLPASDYSTGTYVIARALDGTRINVGSEAAYCSPSNLHTTYSFTWGSKKVVSSAEYRFFLNKYPTEAATADFTHNLNQ